ncbi:MAG: hypothetical protein HGGPFJEG_02013 [Ignavibacteria bacterium]|nr:hypothetical protein [Ignavibacteria bacterium]
MKLSAAIFTLILIFSFSLIDLKAQYKLQPAFPSMPDFSNPIEVTNAGDGTNRIFVAQQRGLIYVFNNSPTVSTRKTFMNFSSKVSSSGSEKGLLGLAFHPDYENNRYLYLNFTFDSAGSSNGYSRISRFTASSSNPDTVLLNTELILLTVAQPYSNHNGGKIAFGPDGYLYFSFGDGGSGGDPQGNGQNKSTLLGKIHRINVDSASGGLNYSIPVTNPFYGNISGYKQEIYAYGLRNTWKFNFDYTTGQCWAGDVGQNAWEEIDIIENGKNYGWNKMEGFHCYGTCDTTGMGFTRPVWEYSHPGGSARSITGGYVYRGNLLPDLYGKYIYGDYQTGEIWSLTYDGINPTVNALLQDTNFLISTFGEDENNELYVCRYSGSLGRLYKFVNTSVITLNLKSVIQGFYNEPSLSMNLSDTAVIYLRDSAPPYSIVDTSKCILDSLTFDGLCFFENAVNGNYYIVFTHRNSIQTWSKSGGESMTRGGLTNYDFTTDSTNAFGNNLKRIGGIFSVYNGDVNQDEVIDGSDNGSVDNDATLFQTGYIVTDLNADGIVDGSDQQICNNNSAEFVISVHP